MMCEAHLVSCRHMVAQFVSPPHRVWEGGPKNMECRRKGFLTLPTTPLICKMSHECRFRCVTKGICGFVWFKKMLEICFNKQRMLTQAEIWSLDLLPSCKSLMETFALFF